MHFNRSVNSVIVVEMEADVAQGEQDTAGFKQLFGLAQVGKFSLYTQHV